MKTLLLTLATCLFSLAIFAMPTKQEIAKAEPLVQEIMKSELDALRLNKKTRVQVGAAALGFAKEAQAPAEKYLLLTGAYEQYLRGGAYDEALAALDELKRAIPDFPEKDEFALLDKAARSVSSSKGEALRERHSKLGRRINNRARLEKLLEQSKANPNDKPLRFRIATYRVYFDDWALALDEFVASDSAACAAAATAEKDSSTPPEKVADLWWDSTPLKPDFLSSAIRAHAAGLYKKAIAANSLAGLQKVAAEKRVAEAEFAAVQAATSSAATNKKSAKSYVQNGLVAQWDGIENASSGRHQPQRAEWSDLKGGKSISLTKSASFSDNALVCDGTGYAGIMKGSIPSSKIVTAEIVFEIVSTRGNSCLFSTGEHKSFYERCFGLVAGGTSLVFADHVIGKATNGRHSCHLNFSNGEFYMDGVKGVSVTKGTLDAMPARGDGFYIGGFRNSAIMCNIHSIRFYDRKLTDEEVKRNFQVDKERFCL